MLGRIWRMARPKAGQYPICLCGMATGDCECLPKGSTALTIVCRSSEQNFAREACVNGLPRTGKMPWTPMKAEHHRVSSRIEVCPRLQIRLETPSLDQNGVSPVSSLQDPGCEKGLARLSAAFVAAQYASTSEGCFSPALHPLNACHAGCGTAAH